MTVTVTVTVTVAVTMTSVQRKRTAVQEFAVCVSSGGQNLVACLASSCSYGIASRVLSVLAGPLCDLKCEK